MFLMKPLVVILFSIQEALNNSWVTHLPPYKLL
jgi:hypothetical protein